MALRYALRIGATRSPSAAAASCPDSTVAAGTCPSYLRELCVSRACNLLHNLGPAGIQYIAWLAGTVSDCLTVRL